MLLRKTSSCLTAARERPHEQVLRVTAVAFQVSDSQVGKSWILVSTKSLMFSRFPDTQQFLKRKAISNIIYPNFWHENLIKSSTWLFLSMWAKITFYTEIVILRKLSYCKQPQSQFISTFRGFIKQCFNSQRYFNHLSLISSRTVGYIIRMKNKRNGGFHANWYLPRLSQAKPRYSQKMPLDVFLFDLA